MKFSIKDFFSKCDQIRNLLRIYLNLLKESLVENFIFCVVSPISLRPFLMHNHSFCGCIDNFDSYLNHKRVSVSGKPTGLK